MQTRLLSVVFHFLSTLDDAHNHDLSNHPFHIETLDVHIEIHNGSTVWIRLLFAFFLVSALLTFQFDRYGSIGNVRYLDCKLAHIFII